MQQIQDKVTVLQGAEDKKKREKGEEGKGQRMEDLV